MKKLRVLLIFAVMILLYEGLRSWIVLGPTDAGAESELVYRSSDEQRSIDVYKRTADAVVYITTVTFSVDPYDLFLKLQPQEGTGSGVIVDAERGIVITNYHVIKNADRIEISVASSTQHKARLVGLDPEDDLAVLQIVNPPKDLVALQFGDSAKLEIGQQVLAIGNPFGLNRTLTQGIVSSLHRAIRGPSGALLKELIQTDAAINPGNSGGPLLDLSGKLIGLNSAILSGSGASAGIGFAVPANRIRQVLPELIATGKVLRPDLGWVLVDTNQGAMVYKIIKNSPADEAGVQPVLRWVDNVFVNGYVSDIESADLIVGINGVPVKNKEQVEEIVNANGGKPLKLTLRRGGLGGKEREVTLKAELR